MSASNDGPVLPADLTEQERREAQEDVLDELRARGLID